MGCWCAASDAGLIAVPKGVCDPAPEEYNTLYLGVLDDRVAVTVLWSWDGVSVYPDCDGPIVSVRVQNLTDAAVSALLPNARKQAGRVYTLQPGADITITSPGTLKNLGYETIRDMDDLTVVEV